MTSWHVASTPVTPSAPWAIACIAPTSASAKKLKIEGVMPADLKRLPKTVQQNLKRLERMAKRAAKRLVGKK